MAGRYIVMCFFGSAAQPRARAAIDAMLRHRNLFDDQRCCFFGISIDPADKTERRVQDSLPGVRFLWDFDTSRKYGALPREASTKGPIGYRPIWVIVDPTLHVLATFPFSTVDDNHDTIFAYLSRLPAPENFAGFEIPAPVLILPNAFELELCQQLIGLYDADGGQETGVVRNDGRAVVDASMKRRKDYTIIEQDMIQGIQRRVMRRVVPEIEKLFFMKTRYMDRYIVGCYAAEDAGHFEPHRDNTSSNTAHRRFAISINLNSDFDGGELRFPEYSRRGFKAPTGWAVVFPCAILHRVMTVTRGRRYAFLSFVYDDEGAKILAAATSRQ
jgi:peroxiredoxin